VSNSIAPSRRVTAERSSDLVAFRGQCPFRLCFPVCVVGVDWCVAEIDGMDHVKVRAESTREVNRDGKRRLTLWLTIMAENDRGECACSRGAIDESSRRARTPECDAGAVDGRLLRTVVSGLVHRFPIVRRSAARRLRGTRWRIPGGCADRRQRRGAIRCQEQALIGVRRQGPRLQHQVRRPG